jgi:hypothetical protein
MKTKIIRKASYLFIFSIFIVPAIAVAQLELDIDSTTKIPASLSAETNTVIQNKDNEEIFLDAVVDVNSEVLLGDDTEGNTKIESFSQIDSEEKSENSLGNSLELSINNSGIAITSSTQVESDTDLKVFTDSIITENKDIERAEINSYINVNNQKVSDISVRYKHKAKLFGFIPVNIISQTTLRAEGNKAANVDVSTSWWSFLTTKRTVSSTELKSRIESNSQIINNASVDASTRVKAMIIENMITEIEVYTSLKSSS